MLPWQLNFWITIMGSLKCYYDENDGEGNENGKKGIGLYQQDNNCLGASHYFVHFLAVVTSVRHETS